MHSSIALPALFSLAVSAAPSGWGAPGWNAHGYYGPAGWGGDNKAASNGQVPFKFPLANGFPNITVPSDALRTIELQAHGTLPNTPLPKALADASATTFQVLAFNEIFEVAYFTSLLNNITTAPDGWDNCGIGYGAAKEIVINAITAVQGQEQLHALGINAILASAGRTPVQPCEYVFPETSFDDAIALAATFTDLVLGTLQDAELTFGTDGTLGVIPLIGGVIGQEGEQTGFYRQVGGKVPSALPFLTRSAGPFAFSALNQLFVVPGSCPNLDAINVPIFGKLTVETMAIQPKDQILEFSFMSNSTMDAESMSLVYINQQNMPVVEKLQDVRMMDGKVMFCAPFPYVKNIMNGLTIAAVTSSPGPFMDVPSVAKATLFGPGLIEIN